MAENTERLDFTDEVARLRDADVVFIAEDVATDDKGRSDLGAIENILDLVNESVRPDTITVVLSQVPPGFTRNHLRHDHVMHYQVETLIFGRAVERATRPERFIVGCADPSQPLPNAYETFLKGFGCPILPMRLESAELAKISINFCLVASISVTNTLAELCEHIGADWSEIVPALKLDQRIGTGAYLTPGLGIAGGNLERDLATILQIAGAHSTDKGVVDAWIDNSRHRKEWSAHTIRSELLNQKPDAHIAVLGLAYKENTHSVKNSPALACLNELHEHDFTVYDPVVDGAVVPFAKPSASALECMTDADALMILTPWPEFKLLEPSKFAPIMRGRLIIDPYRCIVGDDAVAAGFDYITLGMPPMRSW
jgi:UDPglucose 6-dehydrogenase